MSLVDDDLATVTSIAPVLIVRKAGGWASRAACKGSDPDLFFPERGSDAAAARAVCLTCPRDVRIECLNEVLDLGYKEAGIRAGLTQVERRPLHRLPREQAIAVYLMNGIKDTPPPKPPTAKRRLGPVATRVIPCGTMNGYKAHRTRGQKPCEACDQAWLKYKRDRYAQLKAVQ